MALTTADSEKYEVLEKIGHGSFGIIRKVRRKSDGQILCRKEINYIKMSQKEREQLHAEFSILSSLRHPNIVAYYHREHLKATQDLYLYMEYCGGGDLGQVIKNLVLTNKLADEEFVWRIFSQLVTALYRCHHGVDAPEAGTNVFGAANNVKPLALKGKQAQVMILHRDLKPENIFLGADQSVKLGDFGLSKLMQSHDFASTYVGTPFYMSPEICAAEKYTLQSDIWSMGCIMYELCAKTPPFNAKTHLQLVQKIREGRYAPLPQVYSPELSKVIASCLKVNPSQRPDTATLLKHPAIALMRKEKEVVELGKVLKTREEVAMQKAEEAEERLASLEQDKIKIRHEVEASVRREWEVKARLEIDRQVQLELERLRKKFEREVQEKLSVELEKHTRNIAASSRNVSDSSQESSVPQSSVSTNGDEDFPSSTDLSELSLDSPASESSKPVKKGTKTPFSRSKTTFDSPMDIQMAEPSPMSIASLSLSPRRNAPVAGNNNIFAEASKQKSKWEPTLAYSDDEDDMPELPSPTRPKIASDPFKVPARPGLQRQNTTATMQKLNTQPTLFPSVSSKPSLPTAISQPDLRPGALDSKRTSPNRRLSRIPSSTTLANDAGSPIRERKLTATKSTHTKANASAGGEEMFKAVMQRNMGGRTLVELAQARAGGRPVDEVGNNRRPLSMVGAEDVKIALKNALPEREIVWDPERDEMPSPFLVRGSRVVRNIR